MPAAIKTAEQVVASIDKHRAARQKEQREFNEKRALLESYHDLRDDVVSIIRNSGQTFEYIHAQCGPHPNTLQNWMDKKVSQPRLGKIRSTLRILGYDIGIVEKLGTAILTKRAIRSN